MSYSPGGTTRLKIYHKIIKNIKIVSYLEIRKKTQLDNTHPHIFFSFSQETTPTKTFKYKMDIYVYDIITVIIIIIIINKMLKADFFNNPYSAGH